MEKLIQKRKFVYAVYFEDTVVSIDSSGEDLSIFDLSDPTGKLSVYTYVFQLYARVNTCLGPI